MPAKIEAFYAPEQVVTASPEHRLAGWVLDAALRDNQEPDEPAGTYILCENGTRAGGRRVYRSRTGCTCRRVVAREIAVKAVFPAVGLAIGLATGVPAAGLFFLVAALWCLWDSERQCLWDKTASTSLTTAKTARHSAGTASRARTAHSCARHVSPSRSHRETSVPARACVVARFGRRP